MNMGIHFQFGISFLYTYIVYVSVFAHVKQIQYQLTFGTMNKKDILCAVQKLDTRIVGVKMAQDGENRICEGLEHDWLLNKDYSDGYDYIEKERVWDIFNPPKRIEDSQGSFKWIFPTSFDAGAKLTIIITMSSDPTWTVFVINVFDTVKEDPQISPDVSEIVLFHLSFRNYLNSVVANSYIPAREWGMETTVYNCPVTAGGTHVITLESHSQFIRTRVDGMKLFDFEHAIPPRNAALFDMFCGDATLLYVHNITMNGPL